jgi:hypothetical protein
MPLDGDDDVGVFAIMLPQKSDRSLHGLQSFRPYEVSGPRDVCDSYTDFSLSFLQIIKGGSSDTFVNNFMMLTLRNPDSDAGTLETVLTVLPPQERADIALKLKLKQLPAPSKHRSSTSEPPKSTDEDVTPRATRVTANGNDDEKNSHAKQSPSRKRRKMSVHAVHKCGIMDTSTQDESAHPTQPSPSPSPPSQSAQVIQITTRNPADDVKPHAPITTESPRPSPQVTRVTNSSNVIPLDLTDEQAERVCFIWPVVDDDIEYELVHTLGECKSFAGLLGLLEEESEAIPSAASTLARTNMWRLTYRLGDGPNKAVVARKGTEVAFDRLQRTLAQASIWEDNPLAQINIELKSLSKPDSV